MSEHTIRTRLDDVAAADGPITGGGGDMGLHGSQQVDEPTAADPTINVPIAADKTYILDFAAVLGYLPEVRGDDLVLVGPDGQEIVFPGIVNQDDPGGHSGEGPQAVENAVLP